MRCSTWLIAGVALVGYFASEGPRLASSGEPARASTFAVEVDAEEEPSNDSTALAPLRRVSSRHLMLITDAPKSPEIDRLPELFDAAVPQWAEHFGVDERRLSSWKVEACLISDRRRFAAANALPADLPEFSHGYSRGNRIWLFDQPSDYYRRHLLLHEGTHSFMAQFLGGVGPAWYFEGMAELLATHRTQETSTGGAPHFALNYFPLRREDVPMLGRIKIIQDAVRDGRVSTLDEVLRTPAASFRQNAPYAWCWSVAVFLDHHPRYQTRFRRLIAQLGDISTSETAFREALVHQYGDDWPAAAEEWQLFVYEMVHGYDFDRMAIDLAAERHAFDEPFHISADCGWQSTGIQLHVGDKVRVTASGRFQIAKVDGKSWPSEPAGVTIRYHQGKPLGQLIGAIRPTAPREGQISPLAKPIMIGASGLLHPTESGTLFLRINDSPAELSDNQGQIEVLVARMSESFRNPDE